MSKFLKRVHLISYEVSYPVKLSKQVKDLIKHSLWQNIKVKK